MKMAKDVVKKSVLRQELEKRYTEFEKHALLDRGKDRENEDRHFELEDVEAVLWAETIAVMKNRILPTSEEVEEAIEGNVVFAYLIAASVALKATVQAIAEGIDVDDAWRKSFDWAKEYMKPFMDRLVEEDKRRTGKRAKEDGGRRQTLLQTQDQVQEQDGTLVAQSQALILSPARNRMTPPSQNLLGASESVRVVCNKLYATFFPNIKRFKLDGASNLITGGVYETKAGMESFKKWKVSVRLADGTNRTLERAFYK